VDLCERECCQHSHTHTHTHTHTHNRFCVLCLCFFISSVSSLLPQDLLKEQNVDYSVFSDMVDHSTGQTAFLPLELFDDIMYECRDPDDWVRLGTSDGTRLFLCK
jgi:hypothetical protein